MGPFRTPKSRRSKVPAPAPTKTPKTFTSKKEIGKNRQTSRCSSEYSTTSSIPIRHRTPSCSSEPPSKFEMTMDKLQKQIEENKKQIQDISTATGKYDTRMDALESRLNTLENQQHMTATRLDNYERSERIMCRYCNKNLSISYIVRHQKKLHPYEYELDRFLQAHE